VGLALRLQAAGLAQEPSFPHEESAEHSETNVPYCFPSRGPIFEGGRHLVISDNWNGNKKSYKRAFGRTDQKTTKRAAKTLSGVIRL
jgi:hypothetical protein